MLIRKHFSLQKYNTFQVKAKADFFTEIYTTEELKNAIKFSKAKNIPFLVLGGGSNILLTRDFGGLVILIRLSGITEVHIDENHVLVTAKAGENWNRFVLYCIAKNYGGLENLSLIPGNVGSSPIQNIGAYGAELKNVFRSCKVFDIKDYIFKELNLEDCQFGYRDSIFKSVVKGRYIILEVTFQLTTQNHNLNTSYGDIKHELEKNNILEPNIKDISDTVIAIRQSKLPDPAVTGNAGSFFKNPIITVDNFNELKTRFTDIPHYLNGPKVKIPAGWLIEQSGWKGKTVGNVGCHPSQALLIINATGNASGKEILEFSSKIIQTILEKFGIELEREVNIL